VHESEANRSLVRALRAVAEEDASIGASASIHTRLLEEVRSIAAARRRRKRVAFVAIAAALLIAVAVPARRMLSRPPANPPSVAEVTTEFLPLLYSGVPARNVQMVRIAVPRAALASFGLSPLEAPHRTSSETVLADILVGDDGLARAVRFVRPAVDQEVMP
jgi:hypothetical protein